MSPLPSRCPGAPRPELISQAMPQHRVAVRGVISSAAALTIGGGPAYRCVLTDGTGELDLLFLGRTAVRGLTDGAGCTAEGIAARRGGRLVVWNPRYWLAPRPAPVIPGPHGPAWPGPARASRPNDQATAAMVPRNTAVTPGR